MVRGRGVKVKSWKTSTLTAEEKAFFMEEAIKEARKAEGLAEVPIGAVVVLMARSLVVGTPTRNAATAAAHAEMFAIEEACRTVGSWRLEQAQLFVPGTMPNVQWAMLLANWKKFWCLRSQRRQLPVH